MEKPIFTKEDLKLYAKGTTRNLGAVTLPSGVYTVSHLELKEQEIDGELRKWVDIHVIGTRSGSIPASRLASAGFAEAPVEGRVSKKWYFPSKPIGGVFEGDLADLLVEIQGKKITLEVVEGKVPNFRLQSFVDEKSAKDEAKKGFLARNYYRLAKIA